MIRSLRPVLLLFLLVLLSAAHARSQTARFFDVHRECIVVDGHNDIMQRVMEGDNIETTSTRGHSDIPRFLEGGVTAQQFSIWVPTRYIRADSAWWFARSEVDSVRAILARNTERTVPGLSSADIERAKREGKLAIIIAVEGGDCIEGDPARIIELYNRGLRCFGLTWNYNTGWATCSQEENKGELASPGLTPLGKRIIRLLDSLGVLIDVSHSGEATVRDVLAVTHNPIIASHSSCKALRNHHRNLTDAQIRAIAENGGVVMVNYLPYFISSNITSAKRKKMEAASSRLIALKREKGLASAAFQREYDRTIDEAERAGLTTVRDVADHIDHVVKVAGVTHVGLGSDFDGINLVPVGLEDVTMIPMLTRELLRRGYSVNEMHKILGGNFLRVFRRVTGHHGAHP
jgi:membrane dipeptidase